MKLHIVTVGTPKLGYARQSWELYIGRLAHYHTLSTTHAPDKRANDSRYLLALAKGNFLVTLAVRGQQMDSPGLARFLDERAQSGQGVCFMIGGPDGLPGAVLNAANLRWSLAELTFPHDLAMVMTAEALYRASTINAGHPYHK